MPDAAPATVRDLRRGQIIAAARAHDASGGLRALTIGALEKRLGFSRGVITYHFRDKDEIVDALLTSAIDEVDAATAAGYRAGATPAQKVEAVLRATVRGFLDHPEAGNVLLSFWGRILDEPRVRDANARLYATYRRRAARLLEEGIAAGAFRPVPVDAAAAVLVGTVIGIVTQVHFDPGSIDPGAAVAEAARAAVALLEKPRRAGR